LIPLTDLTPDHQALIVSCSIPLLSAKLADIGMLPGTVWKLIKVVPFAGPLILSNGNTRLSIRREDAKTILVEAR